MNTNMDMKFLIALWSTLLSIAAYGQQPSAFVTPLGVERVLKLSGANRPELEKVLRHYAQRKNTDSWKAACFLIENMDVHFSEEFYWETHHGKKVAFNETAYPDFRTAVVQFNRLSSQEHLHLKSRMVRDMQSITADLLIENIDYAFKYRNTSRANYLSFTDFCEYVLPYRSTCEPLERWRADYNRRFLPIAGTVGVDNVKTTANRLGSDVMNWYFITYGLEEQQSDGMVAPSHLLFRKQGSCENLSNLSIFVMRSQGIAVTFDFVPHWATSTGRHYWNCIIDERHQYLPFVGNEVGGFKPKREPGKVLRITYSKQKGTPALELAQHQIPEGFMRTPNFIDVTDQYWKCADFTVRLPTTFAQEKFVYATVLNGQKWRPIFYARTNRGEALFRKMTCGAIYLPMSYRNNSLIPATSPVLIGKEGKVEILKIRTDCHLNLTIPEKDQYLIYRIGKHYTLRYWDGGWKDVSTQLAMNRNGLTFSRVPGNTVYLLIPEYSKGKERPFTIDQKGGICYW